MANSRARDFAIGSPFPLYLGCAISSLHDLRDAAVIDRRFGKRLFINAIVAYFDEL